MKIVFAGSPEFAVSALERLAATGKVVAVVTQPDKPAGRKKILTPTPVKVRAQELGLPVYAFEKIKNEVSVLKELDADVMITCAYGQLLTQDVLNCFSGGVWNIHASLLPEFRGASPISSAILAGKEYTGVTVMRTELSLDTGAMLLVKRCSAEGLTCGELTSKLSVLGAEAAVETVELLEKGDVQTLIQDEEKATYCKKIKKADGKIDFARSSRDIYRLIKAFSPEPAAYCLFNGGVFNVFDCEYAENVQGNNGEVVLADKKGITVKCGDGCITFTEVQPAGGKRMRAADFVNGRKIKAGDVLD